MDKVTMTHPELGKDQPVDVLPLAVEQMKRSGWVPVEQTADDGTRQVAAQQATQQATQQSPAKPAQNTAPQKPGKDGADS